MGGKSGGGQHVPYEAPNSLSSAQSLKIIDVVSEGEIAGFANGQNAPFKSVFLNDTVVQNADGSFNFKGITGFFQRGTPDQSYVPGFDASERTVSVSAAVKYSTPVVRSVSDPLVSRLRVTVGVERNARVADNGDTLAADTSLTVTLSGKSGSVTQQVRFTEKGSGAYYQDAVFDKLPSVPFTVRVSRNTPDSTSDKVSNNTFFASFVEIVDARLCYPHTAFAALHIDSDQFGSSVPRRNFLIRGLLLQVPSNYDPETRSYAGIWDGSFKTAWTNNPAWVFYDLLTRPRYSTLARRLLPGQIDKWALYEIGRYCDDLVPDGFGGQEPRYVCNAYITDMKQAGELLQTLCSVFCGLPLWNGERLSVVADLDADPIALYTNANVLDGQFSYGSAALKSIHTAVQVQYLDKNDSYRAKTEYVADDEAVARYGLNIKQVTAFGCDSRGQAVRFAQWTLQTELRQQNTVTFTVGREGLKHLPWDIVQVMDNDYAGAELSGRLKAVSGDTATLDRPVKNAVGSMLRLPSADGIVSAKVTAQPAPDTLVLDAAPAVAAGDVWILSGRVKPRLYRCVGIKENTDEGTYTVTALLHDPAKYAAVDTSADFSRDTHSLHRADPLLANPSLHAGGGKVTLTWDNLTADGQVLSYDIKIYRDGKLYRHIPDAASAEIVLHGLPKGSYRAEIRGRNARGVYSEPLVRAWTLDYEISAVRTVGKTLAVDLVWTWPQTVADELAVEIRYGRTADLSKAQKLAELPYPQNTYTLTGVGAADEFWFWLRVRDAAGNTGEFTTPVRGTSDPNPAPLVKLIERQITESSLSQSLKDLLDGKIEAGKNAALAEAGKKTAAEAAARAKAIADEAAARRQALAGEAEARSRDIRTAAKTAADDLAAKSRELGTKITSVETVNNTQATQIQTVTAAQGKTAAGLELEKKARADGDKAEAQARQSLAAKLDGQIAGITREQSTLADKDKTRAAETAALNTRMEQAEGSITSLRESVAQADRARVQAVDNLTARLGNLSVGGRNLLKQSAPDAGYDYLARFALAEAPAVGEDVTVTLWGELGADRTGVGIYNSRGLGLLFNLTKVSDGLWRGAGKWALPTDGDGVGEYANNSHLNVYFFPNSGASTSRISRIKLERGTMGTDWTPAPEDVGETAERIAADVTNLKQTSVTRQQAEAIAQSTLSAKFQVPDTRDDNQPPSWYWENYPRQNVTEFKKASVLGLRGGVGNNAFCVMETSVPFTNPTGGQVFQTASLSDGTVWRRKSDVSYILATSTYSRDAWTDWQQDETVGGAQAKADAVKKIADAAKTLAERTEADFSGYKRTAAERDKAVAEELKTAKAEVAGNTSQITSLKSAKADKTEVASIAQTALESRWLAAADRAKVAAVTAAAQTAQDKADAAKAAALAAAERAAQAKADTAKAAAVAAAAGDAQSKADAAKAQAIADAAAKDAVVKQQAAADAKAKADKALADAKAYADGLNAAAEAKISRLEQTSVTVAQAEAIVQKTMSAKFQVPDTRNDNQPPSWYWQNYKRQTVTEFKTAAVIGLRGGVGRDGFAALETRVPFENPTGGEAFQTASLSDGTVWRRKSDVVYTHETRTYTKDQWTDWVQDETVDGAQAKADAVKKIAEEVGRLARRAQADIERFQSTYADEKKAEAEDKMNNTAATVETTSKALTTLDGKVQAMHGIKTETIARGRKVFAGITLGADGQTAESEVLVWADKFAVIEPTTKQIRPMFTVTRGKVALSGDLIADGTVQAKHIQTSTLSAISANLGNVTAGSLNSVSINNGNGSFTVDARGNLYAKNGRFEGTVKADKIEGDVLKMYHLPQGRDGYTLHLGAVPFPRLLTFLSLQVTASGFVSQVVNEAGSHAVLVEISLNGQTRVRREVHPQYTGTFSEVSNDGRLIHRHAYVDNRANLVSSLALDSGREHDIRVTFSGGKTQPDEDIVCFVGRA